LNISNHISEAIQYRSLDKEVVLSLEIFFIPGLNITRALKTENKIIIPINNFINFI